MHHAVLHNGAAEAAADGPNNTPPSFPVFAIKHQTIKLPRHKGDTEGEPQDVSCQGM